MNKTLSVILFSFFVTLLHGKLSLPSIFSDNMVLQRDQSIPVWGWSEVGNTITIELQSKKVSTVSGADGKWMLKLDPMKASSTPLTMKIEDGAESLQLKNILIGEVWLCSGQSNMQWTLGASAKTPKNPKYKEITEIIGQEIESSSDPLLRQISVPNIGSPLEKQTQFEGAWVECSPQNNSNFTATGYYFAKELREKLGVPVGLIRCAWGGSRIQPWIPKETYLKNDDNRRYYEEELRVVTNKQQKWDPQKLVEFNKLLKAEKNPQKRKQLWRKKPKEPYKDKQIPSTIYNGIIHPIIPYAIKGVIWYQGESNAGHMPEQYKHYLGLLVSTWRELWKQGDFPFYYAQLANFREINKEPIDNLGWATVCNQQRLALEIKNTGMAVLNDIGEAEDIHPRNKIDVGKRLSLWALAKDYHFKDLVFSGPLYKSSQFEQNKVRIHFDSVGSGLMTGKKNLSKPTRAVEEKVGGFQICGKDRIWKWAQAQITSKDTITVSHSEITEPTEVRYAWASNPPAINLYNKEGLPTSIFSCKKE